MPSFPPQHKQGVFLSRASSISLTVEHALESFSFLNTSDMEDSEGSEEDALQDERWATGMGPGAGCGPGAAGMGVPSSGGMPPCPSTSRWVHLSWGQSQLIKEKDLALLGTPHVSMGTGCPVLLGPIPLSIPE